MSKKELKIKPKILYVDDESINLTLFKVSFKSDYMIQTSSSGEEALEILNKNQHFDIIISDQRMPGLTGTEFMIKAKKKSPNFSGQQIITQPLETKKNYPASRDNQKGCKTLVS